MSGLMSRFIFSLILFPMILIAGGIIMTVFGPAIGVMQPTAVLGIGSAMSTVYQLVFVGVSGLLLLISLWLIFGDLRTDVFQGQR